MPQPNRKHGFTLIELSIVLVIIGLIVGGVLVGRDLISAAALRAQIAQIEKYQAAVNTFKGKYGYLPGDIPNPEASQFQFISRGSYDGQGDGNGVLDGNQGNQAGKSCLSFYTVVCPAIGESTVFWVDLTTAKLVDGSFSTANETAFNVTAYVGSTVDKYLPKSKLGQGYVYVWGGGWVGVAYNGSDGANYFTVAAVTGENSNLFYDLPLFTVAQAYATDKKMDDGLPQAGTVMTLSGSNGWAAGGSTTAFPGIPGLRYPNNYGDSDTTLTVPGPGGPVVNSADIGNSTPAGPDSCYDGSAGLPEQYSINQNGGRGVNCWLAFRFQ